MAKTITRLEESDIDIKGNELHKTMSAGLAVVALLMTSPPKLGETSNERVERVMVNSVLMFLNYLNEVGYVITKKEDIPSAFLRGE